MCTQERLFYSAERSARNLLLQVTSQQAGRWESARRFVSFGCQEATREAIVRYAQQIVICMGSMFGGIKSSCNTLESKLQGASQPLLSDCAVCCEFLELS